MVAAQEAEPKYVICNADESEPGTFKDRQILAEQPHLVIEGMLAGMLAIGAEQGWVFIRHEYGPEEAAMRAELDSARAQGILGEDVLGSGRNLNIDVFTSPGGYILGEESALLECMEGHRGEPRNKPPFPGTNGLWGKPTLMNSVETFAAIPIILQRGAEWWKDQGVNGGAGLKFFAISGDIARPDVYCVPMGTTARELIELAGGLPEGVELAGVSARRRVVELPRARTARRAARLQAAGRGRIDARLRRRGRHRATRPTSSPPPPTCSASSATSRAASACRAGSDRTRRTAS